MFSASFKIHPRAFFLLLGLVVLLFSAPASADDRDLLRTSTANPYVFIILDTSGSMNWTPPCTQAQFNAGSCSTLCPYRDCFTRMQADDPNSKTYQAKKALYTVLTSLTDIQFGFATYNEDNLSVRGKHWIYKAGNNGVTLPGAGATPATVFPANGADEVFGYLWACNTGSGNNQTGCAAGTPALLSDPWSVARMQRLPKGGTSFSQPVVIYVSWAGSTYKITYTPTGASVPSAASPTIQVIIRADKCTNGSCSSSTLQGTTTMTYTLGTTNAKAEEFLAWDNENGSTLNTTITAANPTIEYFPQGTASDSSDTNTCSGWDPNTDSANDDNASSYNLKWSNTNTSDPRGAAYYVGDVVPFDWLNDQKQVILGRLAPNLVANPAALPDFRISTYFNDVPQNSETFLRLKDPNARPLIVNGSTPIGASMSNFNTWYSTWKTAAASSDPQWGCRQKFLIFITDGDETCGGSPCSVATTLLSTQGIKTYVIGLGLDSASGNVLTCMATNGGTGTPIYPQNEQDLIDALGNIFNQIKEASSSFASAAVPSVQIEAADKIYVSNFTPLDQESIWNGRIDAYLKPLPLTAAGLPDRNTPCPLISTSANPRSACHLWDAADMILQQAPLASDLASASVIDATALHLGSAVQSQRRVFYGMAASGSTIPSALRLFYPPPSVTPAIDSTWQDLFQGFNFPGDVLNAAASAARVRNIMKTTLQTKSSTINNANGTTTPVTYVLGDTFHADPTVIDKPNDFSRYQADLYSNGVACGDNASTGAPLNPGYKCFANKLQFRRKLLTVAADDGQVHFFDAGIYQTTTSKYDDGAGWEIFSYIPRLGLPIVRDDAEKGVHIFGPDLTPRVQDVFLDPAHNGTPTAADRQWRTVLIGGFREGGKPLGGNRIADFTSGYFALDITQPDTVDSTSHVPTNALLPSCMSLTNATVSTCGPNPFPALLWEFTDSLNGSRLDEDGNGFADLGQTWSQPTVGRIQIKNASNQVIDKWVAIFGGGIDADFKTTPRFGNYIYIVDIETGQVLYKRQVTGGVPAEPAAVDTNNDGVLDTIYIGTTAGFLYKIDMSNPVQLQNVTITRTQAIPNFAVNQTVQRITDSSWAPVAIFDTGGKPIYLGATVMFVQSLNGYAIAFGTGDREDLWNFNNVEGRFYLIVDQGFNSAQTEAKYTQVTPTGSTTSNDLVSATTPPAGLNRGWYIRLAANERVITKTFGLSGLVVFSSFQPQVTFISGSSGPVCGRTGQSFVYTIYAKNGNPVLHDPGTGALTRYQEQNVFMAPPTIDQPTKNPNNPNRRSVATLTAAQMDIMKTLMTYFPKGTKFGNFFYTVEAMGSDTRYVGIAAIPVGILERNWRQVQ